VAAAVVAELAEDDAVGVEAGVADDVDVEVGLALGFVLPDVQPARIRMTISVPAAMETRIFTGSHYGALGGCFLGGTFGLR